MIRFVGDIHMNWNMYRNLIENCDRTIQVGDLGLGFAGGPKFPNDMLQLDGFHNFIRGNHDNPYTCHHHPWYLGDYGHAGGVFYVGGAWTPDFYLKQEGRNWWREEELEYAELQKAVDWYTKVKPKIVVTHDCPRELKDNHIGRFLYKDVNGKRFHDTRTDNALQVMLEIHQPDIWVFGHYHKRFEGRVNGTKFICLETFGVFDLD